MSSNSPSVLNRIEEILTKNLKTDNYGITYINGDDIDEAIAQILEEFRSLVPPQMQTKTDSYLRPSPNYRKGYNACRSEILDKIGGE